MSLRGWTVAHLVYLLLATLLVAAAGPAQSAPRPDLSRIRVLAIAPFADEASLSRQVADWGSVRLGDLLARGRFQIVPSSRVATEMQRLGFARSDLISPSRTIAVGQAVGADAVLTGRVTLFMVERERGEIGAPSFGEITARVDLDVRVLDVATRVNLFQDTFSCTTPSVFGLWLDTSAMECVVRSVASTLTR